MPESTPTSKSADQSSDPFGSTRWSLVLAAGRDGSTARDAMEVLCQSYWFPVYAFVRRRFNGAEDSQDLTQAFFTQLLEQNTLDAADRTRGRFRAFLLTALKNFLTNEHEKASAQKRGGGRAVASLDFDVAEKRLQRDAPSTLR